MRVSSLSNERVIELIAGRFVPVWISRDRYQLDAIDRNEQLLLGKIDLSRRTKKLESGAVCVYIARASGEVLATLPVQRACKPELLQPFLKKIVDDEKLTVRKAEDAKASRAPDAKPPEPKTAEGRVFVVRCRIDDKNTNRGIGRDTTELTREEWTHFVPEKLQAQHAFDIPRETAEKLLRFAYPPLPHWSDAKVKMTTCTLKGTVTAVNKGEAKVRLTGKLELIYPYLNRPTDGTVASDLLGFATVKDGKLTGLTLVSRGGTFKFAWDGKPQPTRTVAFSVEMQP